MPKALTDLEMKVYDDGHRLIPGLTHGPEEDFRNAERYHFFRRIIQEDLTERWQSSGASNPVHVLDLGCSVGHGCVILAAIPGVSVLGIDNSENAIHYAGINFARPNVQYRVADVPSFVDSMAEQEWDYVCAFEFIEHIENGLALLERLRFRRFAVVSTPYNEPQGVNPHHVVWNVTERSFHEVAFPRIFFFQDDLGNIRDSIDKPESPINLVALLYHSGMYGVVEDVRTQVQYKSTLDRIDQLARRIADLNAQLAQKDSRITDLNAQIADFEAQITDLNAQIVQQDAQIKNVLNSHSWRLTAPFRKLKGWLDPVKQ